MIIEFKYSVIQDLMYHILAHMKVENSSNLYSEAYIDNVNKIKILFNKTYGYKYISMYGIKLF